MELNLRTSALFLSIITIALSAGLFYAWSISAIPGFKNVTDKTYLESMQSINRSILNPWFFCIFLGPLPLLILSSIMQFRVGVDHIFYLILITSIIYILGNVGVTMMGNVPLNEMLDKVDLTTLHEGGIKDLRETYEAPWNRLNHIRAFFSVLSFTLLLLVAFLSNKIPLDH